MTWLKIDQKIFQNRQDESNLSKLQMIEKPQKPVVKSIINLNSEAKKNTLIANKTSRKVYLE